MSIKMKGISTIILDIGESRQVAPFDRKALKSCIYPSQATMVCISTARRNIARHAASVQLQEV
jgi:hypothetical protein